MTTLTSSKTQKMPAAIPIRALRQEVALLRSAVISVIGKDEEGVYRSAFIQEALRSAREKPTRKFRNAALFLHELHRA